MKAKGSPLLELTAAERDAIVRKWLAQTLQTYPEQTSRFLLRVKDPFHNPVGRAVREGLPVIFEEVAGSFDTVRIAPILDEIIHIRAVQEFTAGEAVDFVFFLRQIIHETLGAETAPPAALDRRIDELALMAFDLYMKCREKKYEIKAGEARRRMYLLERVGSAKARS